MPPARESLVPSATVIFALPSNATLLIVLAVCILVAELALPVIVPVAVRFVVVISAVESRDSVRYASPPVIVSTLSGVAA